MKIDAGSDIGRVRETNQDYVNYVILSENEFFCVLCDGMGGHRAGEVASTLCGEDLMKSFPHHPHFESDKDIQDYFAYILEHANHLIKSEANQHSEYEGMGTTAVIAYINQDHIYISHVGDSRAYIYAHHHLVQITEDDTLVNDLMKKGYITPSQAKNHPKKNILSQAVGVTAPLDISFHKYIGAFDALLLCSDGLYNSLNDDEIVEILNLSMNVNEKTSTMLQQARMLGGNDNISVLLVEGAEVNE